MRHRRYSLSVPNAFAFLVVLFAATSFAQGEAPARVTRAAILPFATGDNYYRSMVEAANLTSAIQARLSAEPNVQWVERSELGTAMDELNLNVLNFSSGAAMLRVGKWVKAEWLVIGQFSRHTRDQRVLTLGIVDSARAELIVQREMVIVGDTRDAVALSEADIEQAANHIHLLIAEARKVLNRSKTQVILAPLFFRNVSNTPRLDYLETDLANGLSSQEKAFPRVHVLRLLRTEQAVAESELVVLGLVDADALAWQRVADVYVWGDYQEEKAEGVPFEQVPVSLRVYISRGQDDCQEVTKATTVERLSIAMKELSAEVLTIAERPSPARAKAIDRKQVAERLNGRAEELAQKLGQYGQDNPDFARSDFGKAVRRDLISTLEAAHFFDPLNKDIFDRLLGARWSRPGPHVTQKLDFMSEWRRIDDIERYRRLFGTEQQRRASMESKGDYITTLGNMLRATSASDANNGLPIDVPIEIVRDWNLRFARKFVAHVTQIIRTPHKQATGQNPSPHVVGTWLDMGLSHILNPNLKVELIEAVWPVWKPYYISSLSHLTNWTFYPGCLEDKINDAYRQVNRPERVRELLAFTLTPTPTPKQPLYTPFRSDPGPLTPRGANYPVSMPGPRERSDRQHKADALLSRIPDARPGRCSLNFSKTEELKERVRLLQFQNHSLPDNCRPKNYFVEKMTFDGNRLWISCRVKLTTHQEQLLPPRLFCYEPAGDCLYDVTDKIGQHSVVNDMVFADGKLWIALAYDGVWTIDPTTLAVHRFTGKDGVLTPNMQTIAAAGGRLLFGGTTGLDPKVSCYDRSSGRWTEQGIVVPESSDGKQLRFPVLSFKRSCGFEHWLLMGGMRQLLVDTRTGKTYDITSVLRLASPYSVPATTPPSLIPRLPFQRTGPDAANLNYGAVVAMDTDERGFWIAGAKTIVHYSPNTQVTDTLNLDAARITCIASDHDILWVAVSLPSNQRRTLPARFQTNQWMPFQREQARYYVLGWHAAKRKWIGKVEMSFPVTALAASPDWLWVAVDCFDESVMALDKTAFLKGPEDKWLAQPVLVEKVDLAATQGRRGNKGLFYVLAIGGLLVFALGFWRLRRKRRTKDVLIMSAAVFGMCVSGTIAQAETLGDAVEAGNINRVRELLKTGTDVNKPNVFGGTVLMQAARTGSVEMVRTLIEAGAHVDAASPQGWTALMAAARCGHLEVVKELIKHGADVNAEKAIKETMPYVPTRTTRITCPLLVAAEMGHVDVVKYLVKHGAVTDAQDLFGQTPLILAAKNGQTETVRFLLSQKANVDKRDFEGSTAIIWAVRGGYTDIVECLIANGSVLDSQNSEYDSPLQAAVDEDRPEVTRLLLKKGANPVSKGRMGELLLYRAFDLNDTEIIRAFLECRVDKHMSDDERCRLLCRLLGLGDLALFDQAFERMSDLKFSDQSAAMILNTAASRLDVGLIKKIVARGGNLNARNKELTGTETTIGGRLLHTAISQGSVELVTYLLDNGVDLEAKDYSGRTPLMAAIQTNQIDLINLLIKAGADVSAVDKSGRSVTAYAQGRPEILGYLSSSTRPATTTATYTSRVPARKPTIRENPWLLRQDLVEACLKGSAAQTDNLLKRGADANWKSNDGWPMVVLAANKGFTEVVRVLLDHGADINASGPGNWTALMQAAGHGHTTTVRLLIDRGAQLQDQTRWRKTALDIAEERGFSEPVRLLEQAGARTHDGRILMGSYNYIEANTFEALLASGTDINAADHNGHTVLFYVLDPTYYCEGPVSPRRVKYLLEHGANPNVKNVNGLTALSFAILHTASPEIIKLLLQHGAKIDVRDRNNETPLMLAKRYTDKKSQKEVTRLLMDAGAKQ